MSPAARVDPLVVSVGRPLRVAAYEAIAGAIADGRYPPGSPLPSDAEFTVALGVSRTVVREALLLLEEDHLIRTRRGVGRFVVDRLPALGWERLQPIERMLDAGGPPVSVRRVQHEAQAANDYLAAALGVQRDAPVWVWESVISRGDEPLCTAFECVVADETASTDAARRGSSPDAAGRTLLAHLVDASGYRGITSTCEMTGGLAGEERAERLGVEASAPVLVVTQTVRRDDKPLIFAKYVLAPSAGPLSLQQQVTG
ncbi:GntR family transcriptional regulator [Microbacterium sp. LRZ72]|uniref:GntR family transcriptional regulator n=1 Tax=Microbacterium sp. LRZ72 TaxID=2942481 RepID=UPI0029A73CEC|nr:GntR family transcriptional regulator [Microbacterium sp. LRZ72]MDX2375974.1 GntR family transcriptional regulator [Microbacterium sp. LRZ72]